MRKVLKVKVVSPWIPVSERLPGMSENVLVYYPTLNEGTVLIDFVSCDNRFVLDDHDGKNYFGAPTHWMPLPGVPK